MNDQQQVSNFVIKSSEKDGFAAATSFTLLNRLVGDLLFAGLDEISGTISSLMTTGATSTEGSSGESSSSFATIGPLLSSSIQITSELFGEFAAPDDNFLRLFSARANPFVDASSRSRLIPRLSELKVT